MESVTGYDCLGTTQVEKLPTKEWTGKSFLLLATHHSPNNGKDIRLNLVRVPVIKSFTFIFWNICWRIRCCSNHFLTNEIVIPDSKDK
jgi:hypothetical protein